MDEHDSETPWPEGVPRVWAMCDRRGRPVNRHRFTGGMRHDGALWCVACERWENLRGEEFPTQ